MIKMFIRNILPYGLVSHLERRRARRTTAKDSLDFGSKISALIQTRDIINLELGAGNKKGSGDWITMDLDPGSDIPFNLLDKFPFPDCSVNKIYSSHFLEHFYTKDIKKILKECFRVLKPGGWISACVPDGSIYIKAYVNNQKLDPEVWLRYHPAATILSDIDVVNYMAYMDDEHKHLFDIENLLALFHDAGFKDIKPRPFIENLDLRVRDYQSIYVEGIK